MSVKKGNKLTNAFIMLVLLIITVNANKTVYVTSDGSSSIGSGTQADPFNDINTVFISTDVKINLMS